MKNTILYKGSLLFVFLIFSSIVFSQDKIISQGDTWKYYDYGNLDTGWENDFRNNNLWKTGITPIGYGDNKVITKINYGKSLKDKDITKYFSKTFTLNNPLDYIAYELKFQRDDGIVIYLNGKEIYRDNMPKGIINGNSKATYAILSTAESAYHSKIVDSKDFIKGENNISVSIHQYKKNSSDCLFNFELLGHDNPRVLSVLIDEKTTTNSKLENQIKNLGYKFEIKNSAIQIELLKNTNENFKFLLFLISFLLIASFISLYLLITKYKKNQESFSKNIINLNEDLFNKDREMMTISTQLLHNKQHFKEIKSELKHVKTEQKSTIKSIIQQIDLITEKDEEWINLKKHFNTVFSGFYNKLIKDYPTLTETELRHCMFIKLHMQTKEIARILNVDPRSVQASRYRIKKKMNLNEETDLRNHIVSMT
jgi:DNA-binding CsgD family transcriptional regulator